MPEVTPSPPAEDDRLLAEKTNAAADAILAELPPEVAALAPGLAVEVANVLARGGWDGMSPLSRAIQRQLAAELLKGAYGRIGQGE